MDDAGLEHAAILLMAVGEEEAAEVFKYLSPKEVQKLGETMARLRTVPREKIDDVIGRSLLVENTLPAGSNWDGKTGLLVDEKTFKELLGGRTEAPPASQTQASVR